MQVGYIDGHHGAWTKTIYDQIIYIWIILILLDKGIKHIVGFPNQRRYPSQSPILFHCRAS